MYDFLDLPCEFPTHIHQLQGDIYKIRETKVVKPVHNLIVPYVAVGVFSALVMSPNLNSGSPLSLLHRFTMLSVAGSTKNMEKKTRHAGTSQSNQRTNPYCLSHFSLISQLLCARTSSPWIVTALR
jgi:hypothetical protein